MDSTKRKEEENESEKDNANEAKRSKNLKEVILSFDKRKCKWEMNAQGTESVLINHWR